MTCLFSYTSCLKWAVLFELSIVIRIRKLIYSWHIFLLNLEQCHEILQEKQLGFKLFVDLKRQHEALFKKSRILITFKGGEVLCDKTLSSLTALNVNTISLEKFRVLYFCHLWSYISLFHFFTFSFSENKFTDFCIN